jgi:hypothetical protein
MTYTPEITMINQNEAYVYTNDHLVKAYSIISTEFWAAHERLSGTFESTNEQLKAINELTRLGNAMVAITEARKAIG